MTPASKRRWLRFSLRTMFVAVTVLMAGLPPTSASEREAKIPAIKYEQVPGLKIIGKLGRPLGEIVTIRGHWERATRRKPAGPFFVVTHLNGHRLISTVEFESVTRIGRNNDDFKTPELNAPIPPHVVWELRGHEFGRGEFGDSETAREEANIPPSSRPPSFRIEFKYVTARRVPD